MSLWFKNLPGGWEEAPLKSRLARNDGGVWGDDPDGDGDTIVLRSTEQRVDGAWNIEAPALRKLSPAEAAGARLAVGDLVVTKSSGSELHIGKTSLVTPDVAELGACYSNFMQRLRVDSRTVPRFVHYWMNNELCREQFAYLSNSTSGLANLNGTVLGTARLAFPSRADQERIANFLDEQTARIDALIAEKERLVTKLQRASTELLHDAVTKGLQKVSMKSSHREWIGDIPSHWTTPYVRFVARLESGHTPSRQHPEYWVDCNIPWFSLADVWQIRDGRREVVTETAEMVSALGLANSSARLLPARTVILSRTASVGFSAIMGVPMATTQDFVNWVCGQKVIPEYLLYVFRSMGAEFARLKFGSTHSTIYMPDVAKFSMPLPPIIEQREIVKMARARKEKMDALEELAQREAERLREYRASLISAAVTGQLNIDDFQARQLEAA